MILCFYLDSFLIKNNLKILHQKEYNYSNIVVYSHSHIDNNKTK